MRLFIFRHGETAWTKTGQHTSFTDLELSSNGLKEGKLLGESLSQKKFTYVFSSPLKRAKTTCFLAGYESQMEIDSDLLEWNYGDYEGLTSIEIQKKVAGWTIFSKGAPNGESAYDISLRSDRFIKKVKALEGDVAIFSSGHISRAIASRWLNCPITFGEHLFLSTASKSILGEKRGVPLILLWNDTSHLKRVE